MTLDLAGVLRDTAVVSPWSGFESIHERDFEAAVSSTQEQELELQLSGNADNAALTPFGELVSRLHRKICEVATREIVIDIRRLEFMSASCFNVLVSWIALIQDLAPGGRYKLRFKSDPAIPWQRRSLRTLSCFATDLITVEA
jgi:hypothetical protein